MPTSQEHQDQYYRVRAGILGRHFAINTRNRVNLLSIDNDLTAPPAGSSDVTARWSVAEHQWENPLLWSARLLPALAAVYQLGNASAEKILLLALESIGSLYKFGGTSGFAGYMVRWDPVVSDKPYLAPGTLCSTEFLIDPTTLNYSYSVPHWDPRHAQNRTDPTLRTLLPDSQMYDEYLQTESRYFFDCRRWEPSMDEMVGMLTIYSVLHELVPTHAVRSAVIEQVKMLGEYLAEHSYILVRPSGGLARRGSAGALSGFEYAFDQAFGRIAGQSFGRRTDFVGAMIQAGYWRVLQGPVLKQEPAIAAAGALLSPLLPALLAADGGLLSGILGPVLSGSAAVTPASVKTGLPFLLTAMPRSLAIYNHRDVFDTDEQERSGPAIAQLLAAVPQQLCLEMMFDIFTVLPADAAGTVRSFLPFVALSSLADPGSVVGAAYRRLMQGHLGSPVTTGMTDGLESCFASAVALLLGAPEAEEVRLVQLLEAHFETLNALGPGGLVVTGATEKLEPGLDYFAGLSLAWLHAKRRADRGDPIRTAGFPLPPTGPAWPLVTVPLAVVTALPHLKQAIGGPSGRDIDLFSEDLGGKLHKPAVPAPELPPDHGGALIVDKTVRVRDNDGDVDTGVTIAFGDEFEVLATGTITAPELFAAPSDATGWYVVDDARFALHAGIDPVNARKYALIGRLGGYFFVGTHLPRQPLYYHYPLRLYLRVNNDDQTRGSGNGAFDAHVRVWRSAPNNASFVRQTVPDFMLHGGLSDVSVTLRNDGTRTWTTADFYGLGAQAPQDNVIWGSGRQALPHSVAPRDEVTFAFSILAPPPGGATFQWRMVQDGTEWFGALTPAVQIYLEASAECRAIRARILDLESEIAGLQADLQSAPPGQRGKISAQIRIIRGHIRDERQRFHAIGCA
ncbi:hypothetical protein [Arthrobacter sp. OV608]|uniref:hypothetical protein n=1 Tax=Arthrobacter sp. OV608 TaxID=1882768 RepID=UPI0008C261CD|nr:hypothetical protein [Arthrobacter sp. OV608]SEQ79716.1 hypothetical protein SAMN05444745_11139 [Arthrobacter sp. OV608]